MVWLVVVGASVAVSGHRLRLWLKLRLLGSSRRGWWQQSEGLTWIWPGRGCVRVWPVNRQRRVLRIRTLWCFGAWCLDVGGLGE